MFRDAALSVLFALAFDAGAQTRPDGNWQGTMERQGAALTVRFDFHTQASAVAGRFTSETQRAMEYPLDEVMWATSALHWKLGDSLVFDGVVSPRAITGTFLDGKEQGTFSLHPVKLDPPPYRREEVTFRNGDVALAGTLLCPRTPGLHPGIVFLHRPFAYSA